MVAGNWPSWAILIRDYGLETAPAILVSWGPGSLRGRKCRYRPSDRPDWPTTGGCRSGIPPVAPRLRTQRLGKSRAPGNPPSFWDVADPPRTSRGTPRGIPLYIGRAPDSPGGLPRYSGSAPRYPCFPHSGPVRRPISPIGSSERPDCAKIE